jgi:hypothetical protein
MGELEDISRCHHSICQKDWGQPNPRSALIDTAPAGVWKPSFMLSQYLQACLISQPATDLSTLPTDKRSVILTAMSVKVTFSWCVAPCNLVDGWHFGGTYCSQLQNRNVSHPEDEGSRSFQTLYLSTRLLHSSEKINSVHYQNNNKTIQYSYTTITHHKIFTCQTQWPCGLRYRLWLLTSWDHGFKSCWF